LTTHTRTMTACPSRAGSSFSSCTTSAMPSWSCAVAGSGRAVLSAAAGGRRRRQAAVSRVARALAPARPRSLQHPSCSLAACRGAQRPPGDGGRRLSLHSACAAPQAS
jgi:hypothetical protein